MVQKGSMAGVALTYEVAYEKVIAIEEFFLVKLDGKFRILAHDYHVETK